MKQGLSTKWLDPCEAGARHHAHVQCQFITLYTRWSVTILDVIVYFTHCEFVGVCDFALELSVDVYCTHCMMCVHTCTGDRAHRKCPEESWVQCGGERLHPSQRKRRTEDIFCGVREQRWPRVANVMPPTNQPPFLLPFCIIIVFLNSISTM